jgi:hypothetical protein
MIIEYPLERAFETGEQPTQRRRKGALSQASRFASKPIGSKSMAETLQALALLKIQSRECRRAAQQISSSTTAERLRKWADELDRHACHPRSAFRLIIGAGREPAGGW